MDLSIVIPAWNEAPNLDFLLPRLHEVLGQLGATYEILVVDNGSEDGTPEVVDRHKARLIPQLDPGYGGALKKGFETARGQWVVTMDADYSHDPWFISDLYRQRHRAAVLVASRYIDGGHPGHDGFRVMISRLLNFVFRKALSLPIRDLSSGFRMYERRALREIRIDSIHFEALEEILIRLHGCGFSIQEIPFHYRTRIEGVSKARIFKFGWRLLCTLLKLWRLRNRSEWADYDDRAFRSRIWLQRYWHRKRYEVVMDLVKKPGRVLDIGCGSSRILQGLPQGVGLDLNLSKLRYLLNRGRFGCQGSVFALPFPDEAFDQVILSQVIEHIPLKPQLMSELNRVLKPGGALILGTPDFGRLFWNVLEEFYDRLAPGAYGEEHAFRYSLKSLRELLHRNGFRVERTRYVGGAELNVRARKLTPCPSCNC